MEVYCCLVHLLQHEYHGLEADTLTDRFDEIRLFWILADQPSPEHKSLILMVPGPV